MPIGKRRPSHPRLVAIAIDLRRSKRCHVSTNMKFKAPDVAALAADQPKTVWGKLLSSTPVVLTVVATLMAGLSNSEMTRAQYDRSLAAQQQSKVGDQWSFFQAKRLRSATLRGNFQVLQSTIDLGSLDAGALRGVAGTAMPEANLNAALESLTRTEVPAFQAKSAITPEIKTALEAVAAGKLETEVTQLLHAVKSEELETALQTAQANARGLDATVSPVTQAIDQLEKAVSAKLATDRDSVRALGRNFTAARLRFDAARYDTEARFNRGIAELLELRVRLSNISADRHHVRSQRFFFGMLAAQQIGRAHV